VDQPDFLYYDKRIKIETEQRVVEKVNEPKNGLIPVSDNHLKVKYSQENFENELKSIIIESNLENSKKIQFDLMENQKIIPEDHSEDDPCYIMFTGIDLKSSEYSGLIEKMENDDKFKILKDLDELDRINIQNLNQIGSESKKRVYQLMSRYQVESESVSAD
jgi:hypothetical protein